MSDMGIDVGGTFTDLLYIDGDTGERISAKSSTTEDVLGGIVDVVEKAEVSLDNVSTIGHGSTIATNAIIEQTGAYTALVTTKEFPDVLEAARANRPELFDLSWEKPEPVVARRDVIEVEERILYDGSVETPLSEADVERAVDIIETRGYEAVAVSYLNSIVNPEHERRTKALLSDALDDIYITRSTEVVREIQEFERTSTTALNAYLGPLIADYLEDLQDTLHTELDYNGDVTLINSAGGAANRKLARETPARFCNSGPAGGVTAARYLAGLAGYDDVITFDMGGTSADLSLIQAGEPEMTTEWRVEWNKPVRFPAIDIETIGAGGGSIAWIDEGGALRVGPRSAGADPGPACYGRGGTEPTVTDANLVLHRLAPEMFLGGDMAVEPDRSRQAIKEAVAVHFDWTVQEAAEAILQVAINNMTNAIRRITVERGYDPRNFTMYAYGGAGPLHAAELARGLDIPRVLVPRYPGVGSAFGVAQPDFRFDHVRPLLSKAEHTDPRDIKAAFEEMEEEAVENLHDIGREPDEEAVAFHASLDIRYYGQTSYLNLETDRHELDEAGLRTLVERFETQFEDEFGYTLPPSVTDKEFVNARLVASVRQDRVEPRVSALGQEPRKGDREVWFDGEPFQTTIYDRSLVDPGTEVEGPAVFEQEDSTAVVPPGSAASADRYGNIVIELE